MRAEAATADDGEDYGGEEGGQLCGRAKDSALSRRPSSVEAIKRFRVNQVSSLYQSVL